MKDTIKIPHGLTVFIKQQALRAGISPEDAIKIIIKIGILFLDIQADSKSKIIVRCEGKPDREITI